MLFCLAVTGSMQRTKQILDMQSSLFKLVLKPEFSLDELVHVGHHPLRFCNEIISDV